MSGFLLLDSDAPAPIVVVTAVVKRARILGGVVARAVDAAFKVVSAQLGGSEAVTMIAFTPGTRTPGVVASGTNPTGPSYPVRGYKDSGSSYYDTNSNAWISVDVIAIFGESLPKVSGNVVEPKVGDTLTLDRKNRKIVSVNGDSDYAIYQCKVR